jgi:hypothetical protein
MCPTGRKLEGRNDGDHAPCLGFGTDHTYLLLTFSRHDARASSHLFAHSPAYTNTASQHLTTVVDVRHATLCGHTSMTHSHTRRLPLTTTSKPTEALRRAIECAVRAASDIPNTAAAIARLSYRTSFDDTSRRATEALGRAFESDHGECSPSLTESPSSISALNPHLPRSSSRKYYARVTPAMPK